MYAVEDLGWRPGRCCDALPLHRLESRQGGLRDRRYVRQQRRALAAGHRERNQLAALDVRQRWRHAEDAELDLAACHVGDRLAAALVGNVDDVDATYLFDCLER